MAITINGTGSITGLTAGGLPDGSVTSADLASGAITSGSLPAGSILQVQSTLKQDAFSTASTSFTDITGLSVSITPSSTNSKILISANFTASADSWDSGFGALFALVRDSTYVCLGTGGTNNATAGFNGWANAAGSTSGNFSSVSINFLDSPSTTSEVTYKVQARHTYTAGTYSLYVGRRAQNDIAGFASVITVMEVAA